jgi:threonine efflux protein
MALSLSQFLTVWAFLAVNIASPGPNVLNTIASAMGSGRVAGLGSAAAVGVGVALWCLGMTLGMAAIFVASPLAQDGLTLAAIGLLALFSIRYLRTAWAGFRGHRALPSGGVGLTFATAFRRSLLVNVLNPKALTSWLAILTFFPVAKAGASDIGLLAIGASTVAIGMHVTYALIFSTPVAARLYLRAGWAISGFAGLFFATFAIRLIAGLHGTTF